ncbi:HTH-type transcriptional regulator LeuO [mine drainage metagenome]|uniref:HTH-type transcriptional regulator LeuO n=1 Tax=mine drainage metagenome TaxID=410659 RepID=A0A1J5TCX9_9ZZZZ
MLPVDLNLLPALDALLAEGSVTAAARRLGLSVSAMSRTLARLRAATGDPLLVRAGRGLAPTPRALELRERVRGVTREALAVLSPNPEPLDLAGLERTFTLRANEGFLARFAAALLEAALQAAPGVRLCFAAKPVKDAAPLREGRVDLEIGVLGAFAPEVRSRLLFRDTFLGAVRIGHPLLAAPITAERYAACRHVVASRRGSFHGPVDEALAALGLARRTVAVVPGFPDALRIAAGSDAVALVPRSCLDAAAGVAAGVAGFTLPVATPEIRVAALWHPRMEADPAHRWLRQLVIGVCRGAVAPRAEEPSFGGICPRSPNREEPPPEPFRLSTL